MYNLEHIIFDIFLLPNKYNSHAKRFKPETLKEFTQKLFKNNLDYFLGI